MQVTSVRIRPVQQGSESQRLLATASVSFDDMFLVHDVRVVNGDDGLFVAMPRRKTPDGQFRDLCHPITSECRAMIVAAVLEAWELHKQGPKGGE